MKIPNHITKKLDLKKSENSLRRLNAYKFKYDFFSNDYLGFAKSKGIRKRTGQLINDIENTNGSTGSRLISGNNELIVKAEEQIAKFHKFEASLIFSSGFLANLGVLSTIPQLGEIILYDELCHASIREGLRLSSAKSFKFKHNDMADLERLLEKHHPQYIVVESVYSMDGDSPNKKRLLQLCEKHKTFLIVDEAHALGVFGKKGEGLFEFKDSNYLFAKMVTYGKALGTHGAAVLSTNKVKEFLVNYCRPFIYTTAPSPHQVASIIAGYEKMRTSSRTKIIREVIAFFKKEIKNKKIEKYFIQSDSPIQCLVLGDIDKTKFLTSKLLKKGFGVKDILSPTVPKGKERIRISLHSYNKPKEIEALVKELRRIL